MSNEILIMLQEALEMFAYLGVKLTALFLVISFIVGVIQDFMPAQRIQSILSSKSGKGYFSAALLGGMTPFCSCSTIPMLTGLLKARAGFGPTVTFLFTSPLLNPIIVGLFLATFGLDVTLAYAAVALVVSVTAGYVLEKLGFERHIRSEVLSRKPTNSCAGNAAKPAEGLPCSASKSCSGPEGTVQVDCSGAAAIAAVFDSRWLRIWKETWRQFTKVLPYLLLGVAIGAFTYGFIPAELIAGYAGADNPLAIPVAAVIGVPLYIRAEAVIPLSAALSAKGMGLGAIMALIIGSAGASLTEVILLRALFKRAMIIAFLLVIFGMAILAGLLFNLFF